jgi:thioredoxin 2
MSVVVACPKCGAKNRVDPQRGDPKCGNCGTRLQIPAATSHPLVVTDASFSADVLSAGSMPVLVDCWAAWCGPCRMLAPTIDQLAAESAGRWKIAKLDTDANHGIAGQYRIESIPTLLIFKGGKLVDRLEGVRPKPHIEAALKKWE